MQALPEERHPPQEGQEALERRERPLEWVGREASADLEEREPLQVVLMEPELPAASAVLEELEECQPQVQARALEEA